MGTLETVLIALIPLALIAWRVRRLVRLLQGGGSVWKKAVFGGLIALGLLSRGYRYFHPSKVADASPVVQSGEAESAAPDSATIMKTAEAIQLIADGQKALQACDTASGRYAFQRAAGIGIEMMNADSLAGQPLFIQGVALAGLGDTASAGVLAKEAARLDARRHVEETPGRASLLRRISALGMKKC